MPRVQSRKQSLEALILGVLQEQARYANQQVAHGRMIPQMDGMVDTATRVLEPALRALVAHSGLQTAHRLRQRSTPTKAVEHGFNVYNPRINEAIHRMAFDFAQSTLETSRLRANEAIEEFRRRLREGLETGSKEQLTQSIREIFASQERAHTLAVTEGSRAAHTGQVLAAQDAGIKYKEWVASGDACEKCLALEDVVCPIDKPFVTLPGGGPYAVILFPPFHPHCACAMNEVLGTPRKGWEEKWKAAQRKIVSLAA